MSDATTPDPSRDAYRDATHADAADVAVDAALAWLSKGLPDSAQAYAHIAVVHALLEIADAIRASTNERTH